MYADDDGIFVNIRANLEKNGIFSLFLIQNLAVDFGLKFAVSIN
jgi:hypothetical protein